MIKAYTTRIINTKITPKLSSITNITIRILLIPVTKEIDLLRNMALSPRPALTMEMRILVISGRRLDTLLPLYRLNISATPFGHLMKLKLI
jgi:hypothetical protein